MYNNTNVKYLTGLGRRRHHRWRV